MTSDAALYIPTYGRVDNQRTWGWIKGMSREWRKRVIMVAHPSEADALRETHGCAVLATPEDITTIAKKRQWIFDQHDIDIFGPYAIMMDDDLRFGVRRKDDIKLFTQVSYLRGEFDRMMESLIGLFDDMTPLVGLRTRTGAGFQFIEKSVLYNARQCDVLGVNVETMRSEGWRFDRVALMEDFDFTLQVITSGYRNALLNDYSRDDAGRGVGGGCEHERDMDKQAEAARRLHELWPDYVNVVEKDAIAWGEWAKRLDVRVSWRKAAIAAGSHKPHLDRPVT